MKRSALVAGVTGAHRGRQPKSISNCCCCRSPMPDTPAFARSACWRRLRPPYWLGEKPVAELELGTLRHIGADVESHPAPRLVPSVEDVRVRHGFVVYSGGRETPSGDRTG